MQKGSEENLVNDMKYDINLDCEKKQICETFLSQNNQ